MAIIDDKPKREPESRLSLLADLVEIISIHPHLLDYPREVEHLMSMSNPSLLIKIKGKQSVIQKKLVAVEKKLHIAQPSGVFKKRRYKVPRKLAVAAHPSAFKRELPSEFHRVIQKFRGVELKLIMEKALTGSDMNRGLGRISLLSSNVVEDFLRPEERYCLENREEIPVLVISPSLEVSRLSLKSWKMSSSLVHVITGGWNIIAHDPKNGLQENGIVQIWSFRTGESLGMAIVKANVGEEGTDNGESSPHLSPRGVLLSSRKYDSGASTSSGD